MVCFIRSPFKGGGDGGFEMQSKMLKPENLLGPQTNSRQ